MHGIIVNTIITIVIALVIIVIVTVIIIIIIIIMTTVYVVVNSMADNVVKIVYFAIVLALKLLSGIIPNYTLLR